MDNKLLLRPVEAATALGISRSKMYELLATHLLPSIRVGNSVRVPVAALKDWVNQQVLKQGERE